MNSTPITLLVLQDASFRHALVGALATRGLVVRTLSSERELLAALGRHPRAVVVLDGRLPLMSGFDLAKAVRRQAGAESVAIIIITEVLWSRSQRVAAIQGMGLLDLSIKPVEAEWVAELIQQGLSSLVPARASEAPEQTDVVEGTAVDVAPPFALTAEGEGADALADQSSRAEQHQVERAARAAQAQHQADLRGNLTATPFPRLLHTLYRRRATGALFLLRDTVKKIVYFKQGQPTYIKSNLLTECLGKVLVREGMINEAQCKESLGRMKEERRQQGTVLIDMGVISPHNLVVGLELQLQTKLLDIFAWSRGEFLFKSEAKIPAEVIRLEGSTATLIADGVRHRWGEETLREALDHGLERYLVHSSDPELRFQELALDEEELTFRDSIDGTRTLRELLAHSPLAPAKAMAVAYILLVTGVIEAREEPDQDQEARLTPEDPEPLSERLAAQLISLRQRDPFGVLGVAVDTSDAAVEEAYSLLAREYHPDRFRRESPDVRQLADEIFGIIYQAYQGIDSAEHRARFLGRLSTNELQEQGEAGGNAIMAERLRRQALAAMNAGSWSEARQQLARAVELCPDAGHLRALLGWAVFGEEPGEAVAARTAVRELRQAVQLDPGHYPTYLYLGRIYLGMGKTILAEKQFEKAVQCNPDCSEALEELRHLKERRPLRQPRRGL